MKVGFTGTRKGMSPHQLRKLDEVLTWLRQGRCSFHAGGSGDADTTAQELAYRLGYAVHVHPCPGVSATVDTSARFTWHEVFPPLVRNRNIVAEVAVLVAAPLADHETLRSGTWATVRYARQAGVPYVVLPRGDGL